LISQKNRRNNHLRVYSSNPTYEIFDFSSSKCRYFSALEKYSNSDFTIICHKINSIEITELLIPVPLLELSSARLSVTTGFGLMQEAFWFEVSAGSSSEN